MNPNKKILLFADWYEPGYKAGGPIRSCVNFAAYMRKEHTVYVFTSDRDLGAHDPYEGIRRDEWFEKEKGLYIYYCSPEGLSRGNIRAQMKQVDADFIYLNSMFSLRYTIIPLMISRSGKLKASLMLSPRGMLRSSAVQFKPLKKKIFLNGFRWLGLHKKVHFLASDETEAADVHRYFGPAAAVTLIPNFPSALPEDLQIIEKSVGSLSMIFVGRIHPIKGLDLLLKVLKDVKAAVSLTIVGSLEDRAFWARCQEMISGLPANVVVTYGGEIPHDKLSATLAKHHIFVLPTKGENFGHAIFEALSLGKPALISDQTPWRGLTTREAGWDLPLDRPDLFLQAIGQAASFSGEEYTRWSRSAAGSVRNYVDNLNLKEEYRKLFT
jgi:glycosyltransferase involved in cell wall biosynthesis